MQIIPLYRYIRPDGGVTNATAAPDCAYTIRYRLIAEEGKALTKGAVTTACVDVDSADGWSECDAPEEESI